MALPGVSVGGSESTLDVDVLLLCVTNNFGPMMGSVSSALSFGGADGAGYLIIDVASV